MATETPKPNSAAPITPNVPYVATRYVAMFTPPVGFPPHITPKKR
jgi:hypothetical protein